MDPAWSGAAIDERVAVRDDDDVTRRGELDGGRRTARTGTGCGAFGQVHATPSRAAHGKVEGMP